jgi:ribose transport system substrate-binding protein
MALALLASVVALAACGSSEDSSTDNSAARSGDSADPAVAEAKAAAEKGFKGNIYPVPTNGPAAQKGKNVWVISCGEAYYGCHLATEEVKKAAAVLDWKTTITDGKASPQVASGLIRQAIAAKADGVIIFSFDCPGIKSALLAAKSASIPVVNSFGLDCDDPAFGSQAKQFTVTSYPAPVEFWQEWSRDRARYLIQRTNGKVTVLNVHPTDQRIHQYADQAFQSELAKCKGCKVIDVPFTFSQVPNPFTQIVRNAVLAHPEANAISNAIDATLDLGYKSVVQAAKAKNPDMIVNGGDGSPTSLEMIKEGLLDVSVFQTFAYNAWAVADSMNRVFAGEDPKEIAALKGSGWQWVDKAHLSSVPSLPFMGSVDFVSGYKKLWGGTGS